MLEKSPTKVEDEGISDVYGRPLTVPQYYNNAHRFYTRIGSMIFSSN